MDGLGRTSLTLNKQQRTADGRLAVTALELMLPGARARCASRPPPAARAPPRTPSEAPAPSPVQHDLPVTG